MKTGIIRSSSSPYGAQTGSKYAVLCADGKIRVATATAEADTFFSIPGRVSVNGRTVTGSIYVNTLDYDEPTYQFSPYSYRKNADALPKWKAAGE